MSGNLGPKLIELSWEENNIPKGEDLAHINDGDIVVNLKEAGYRNDGVYIFKDGEICHLAYEPDDYGCLPKWVKLSKHDFGYSYFSENMIDHNCYVPFNPSEWIMGENYVERKDLTFQYYYHTITITTDFYRKEDGATIKLTIPVMFSLIDIGGPSDHCTYGGGRYGPSESYESFDVNEKKITFRYKYINKIRIVDDIICPEITISEKEINDACIMLQKLLSNLKNTIYVNCAGPCQVCLDSLPVDNTGKWKKIVFPITRNKEIVKQ